MTREEAASKLGEIQFAYVDETREAIDMAIGVLLAIDSLQSEPVKHGEWIDVVNEPYCECSVCGIYIDNLDDDYKFCPRCGAKMDGGKNER